MSDLKSFMAYAIVFFLLISSCKKESSVSINLGKNYYPSGAGHWSIYNVDSTFYGLEDVMKSYQLKEVVDSSYFDNGKEIQIIKRYSRRLNQVNWTILDIWTSTISEERIEKVEENQRKVKLIFPVKENKTWNGNVLNAGEEQEYRYTDVDTRITLDTMVFDSALTVVQQDKDYLTHRWYAEEKYSRNVGLVYFERDSIHFYTNTSGGITQEGFSVKMTLISHSH
ncbi:MAG: hypothetical protein MRY83_02100 [Flavobacteriales bacterium]|nr:hypothetical protein [Flavobacteriales bacterium]